ncbi:hypothetical protein [Pedobacter gandavensis]|uniref:hypothetical protein n=1 Tax=Pedobacter gandavensis TaxID=2679963 RepID=UPI0029301378|nr:hypothetical protein [Pedobacter gandavensis]
MVINKTNEINKLIITKEREYFNYSILFYSDFSKVSTSINVFDLSTNRRYYEFSLSNNDVELIEVGKLNYSLIGDGVTIKNGVATVKGLAVPVQVIKTEQTEFITLKYEQ